MQATIVVCEGGGAAPGSAPSGAQQGAAQQSTRPPAAQEVAPWGGASPSLLNSHAFGRSSRAPSVVDDFQDAYEALSDSSSLSERRGGSAVGSSGGGGGGQHAQSGAGAGGGAGGAGGASALERVLAQLSKALEAASRSAREADAARAAQERAECRADELEVRLAAARCARAAVWRGALSAACGEWREGITEERGERQRLEAEVARLQQRIKTDQALQTRWRDEMRRANERRRRDAGRSAAAEYAVVAGVAGLAVGAALASLARRRQ